jgi:hypothetical protein
MSESVLSLRTDVSAALKTDPRAAKVESLERKVNGRARTNQQSYIVVDQGGMPSLLDGMPFTVSSASAEQAAVKAFNHVMRRHSTRQRLFTSFQEQLKTGKIAKSMDRKKEMMRTLDAHLRTMRSVLDVHIARALLVLATDPSSRGAGIMNVLARCVSEHSARTIAAGQDTLFGVGQRLGLSPADISTVKAAKDLGAAFLNMVHAVHVAPLRKQGPTRLRDSQRVARELIKSAPYLSTVWTSAVNAYKLAFGASVGRADATNLNERTWHADDRFYFETRSLVRLQSAAGRGPNIVAYLVKYARNVKPYLTEILRTITFKAVAVRVPLTMQTSGTAAGTQVVWTIADGDLAVAAKQLAEKERRLQARVLQEVSD